jgi:LPS export ABC transporter permease LptG/LPS export ABC transporter permease LptF
VELSFPVHRKPGRTLYRYVATETLRPTLFALIGLTTVVLTQDLLGFSDLVVNRGLSAWTVALIGFYKAVPIASLMFPFAVLMGCLVALGRLGSDREILALEASGVTAARLVWPFVAFSGAMTGVAIVLTLLASPWANRALDASFSEISREKPWAQIRQGTVTRFGEWQLEAREVNARGDRLRGILLWMPDIGQTIFAQEGRIQTPDDGGVEIELDSGKVMLSSARGAQTLQFDKLSTHLPEGDDLLRDAKDRLPGLTLSELGVRAAQFVASEGNLLSFAGAELHRRFAMPIATLLFGILAVPLFLMRKNFSRSGGGVMGMLCTIGYYGLVQLGQGMVQNGTLGNAAGAWLPNFVIAVLAAIGIVRVRREGVLGHAFDRPQLRAPVFTLRSAERTRRPRRYPLPRYVAARFAKLALLSFAVLVVAYLLIDVMERLEWFSRYRATGIEVLRFYSARVVLLASRVVPMSLLVATALTVSMLAVEGELIGMRACGIPAPRALMPVLFIALMVVPADALLNNVLVPRTNALADELKRTEIKDTVYREQAASQKAAVWYRSGNRILEAERFDPAAGTALALSIYDLGEDRLPIGRTDAESARHVGSGWWLLANPTRIEVTEDGVKSAAASRFADLGEALPAEVDTMHMSVAELGELIETAEADNVDATPLRVDYHVKFAQPLACIVLPAVVLFFAVGGPPFPGPAQTLLVSVVVGISYILLTGVSRSLGYGETLSAFVGGWGPVLLFGAVAAFLGFRLWQRK